MSGSHHHGLAESLTRVCTPGGDGIPGGLLGRVLCGDWHTSLWHTLAHHWPMTTAVMLGLLAAYLGWLWVRRCRWRLHAAAARWLEITPPVSATPGATVHLWRLLATLLSAPRRFAIRPARLVWEVSAAGDRMRAGLWIPPGINATAVRRVVQRAWPGARVEDANRPALPGRLPVAGHRLVVTQPEWLPLTDDPPPGSRHGAATAPEDDLLRAVFDGLAAAGRTGAGLLQVHISRAPTRRVARLRRATVNPPHPRRLTGLLAAVASGVLDLLTPGNLGHRSGGKPTHPYTTQLTSLARRKYSYPPHLLAAVYTAAGGPTTAAAQAAAADISSGYALVSAQLTRRRLHRPRTLLARRWAPIGAMSLVTVNEAAALAGLPAEPAAHGLPAAAARARAPHRDIWTPHSETGD